MSNHTVCAVKINVLAVTLRVRNQRFLSEGLVKNMSAEFFEMEINWRE